MMPSASPRARPARASAAKGLPGELRHRLLLATSRPLVASLIDGLGRRYGRAYAVESVPLDLDAALAQMDAGTGLSAALVDAGVDAPAAVEVADALHRRDPMLPLAALVCCPQSITPLSLRALISAGVSSIVDLEGTPEEALRALRSIVHGGSVLHLRPRPGQQGLLRELLSSPGPRNDMQVELLELVTAGLPDHEIGRRLHISPHTVKHHVEQLRAQVGARNRIELAAWAGGHGFYVRGE